MTLTDATGQGRVQDTAEGTPEPEPDVPRTVNSASTSVEIRKSAVNDPRSGHSRAIVSV